MPELEDDPQTKPDPQPEPDWSWYDLAHEERVKRRTYFIALPLVFLASTLPVPLLARWVGVERVELVGFPLMMFVFYVAVSLAAARWPVPRRIVARTLIGAFVASVLMAVWTAFLWRVGFFR